MSSAFKAIYAPAEIALLLINAVIGISLARSESAISNAASTSPPNVSISNTIWLTLFDFASEIAFLIYCYNHFSTLPSNLMTNTSFPVSAFMIDCELLKRARIIAKVNKN